MVSTSRHYFRQQRKHLSPQQQWENAQALSRHIRAFLRFKSIKNIAIYLPADGELSPLFLPQSLAHKSLTFFLPVLAQLAFQGLKFAPYHANSIVKPNRFNILEPVVAPAQLKSATALDIIFLPLVAYDLSGNRLGMGGGFYDRALQIRLRRPQWKKPLLIGLAHTVQRAESIKSEYWDVPLDGIATEAGLTLFEKSFVSGKQP